jgi:glyoxalase/bleomycin resistance protein/dioxygenase superfamily protein
MMKPIAIPALPCRALDDVVPFYEALGFEIVLRQERPNQYAAMRWRGTDVHLYGVSAHDATTNGTICLLIVDEVEQLHATFAATLKKQLGRVPLTGRPRLTRMKPAQTRFTVTDPAGNSLMIIRQDEPDPHEETKRKLVGASPLGRAMRAAEVLRDFKNEDEEARKVLRNAIKKHATADRDELAKARAMLAELDA